MQTLIYVLKAHLLFSILAGIYHFTLKNDKSFTFNRFYLLAVYGVSVLAPLLEFDLLKTVTFISPNLLNNTFETSPLSNASSAFNTSTLSIDNLVLAIYTVLIFISVSIFLLKFIKSYSHYKLIKRIARFDYNQQVFWVQDAISPFTFLNKTFLPEELKNDENRNIIIKHEEAHRKTFHFFDIFWVELFSSILVFNPLHKKIKKYVVENHEYLADAFASSEINKTDYAQLLVKQTLSQHQLQFMSYFARPTILNRLDMLNNDKSSTSKPILIGLSLVFISLIFSCDLNTKEEIVLKSENGNSIVPDSKLTNTDTIFSIVDEQAEPKDGIQAFYDGVSQDLEGKYPEDAINNKIEGVVYLQFVIEKDGSLSNISPVKGIGYGCDELAAEILKKQDKWNPGRQDGKVVRSQRVIPIRFVLY
jgi:TonB family protein